MLIADKQRQIQPLIQPVKKLIVNDMKKRDEMAEQLQQNFMEI